MSKHIRQYFFAVIFAGVGIYFITKDDYLEGSLYVMAGLSFTVNSLASEPALLSYRKPLTVAAWAFIIATGILFLWVIQFKYL